MYQREEFILLYMKMISKLVNLIFEWLHLKNLDHIWFKYLHIKQPDSVAEHSLNAAQIGYILAKMENADANKVATMLVRHDIAETRIGDMHKVAVGYITNKKELERKVMNDQFDWLDFWNEIKAYFEEMDERITLEWKIAKDADYLEQAFQAKIYKEIGHQDAENRITNVGKALKTESAKKIWTQMCTSTSSDRWLKEALQNLKDV
jgi:putative hydrolases of HD superfamily